MQSPNQFAQSGQKGLLDLKFNPSVLSVEIDVTSAGGLLPGQAVKMVDSAGGIPKVVECADDSDDVFGFIAYNIRSLKFDAYDKVEVVFGRMSVMYMEAAAAIPRNGKVMIVITGQKVATATVGNTIIGRALDKATAAGQLVRVMVDLPGSLA